MTDRVRVKTTYTFNEAIEYLKMRDKQPTKINETIESPTINNPANMAVCFTALV